MRNFHADAHLAPEETENGQDASQCTKKFSTGAAYDDLTTIDWIVEYTKERQRTRTLRSDFSGIGGYLIQLLDRSNVWLILIATGVLVGLIAAGIDTTSLWLTDVKSGYCKYSVEGGRFYLRRELCCWGHEQPSHCQDWVSWRQALLLESGAAAYTLEFLLYVLFSACFSVISAFLIRRYAHYARQSGIPEIKTILGGLNIRHFLSPWTLLIKALGLCLAVSSGLWVGKEGPFVHIACCSANLVMRASQSINNNEARKREVLSAAAASAISVAFGAPIGGVLFSLEQVSYFFPDKTMWQSFVCAMVAAVTLQALDPFRTGKVVLYQVAYSTSWHGFEMAPFILLGLLGGVYGGLIIKLNMLFAKFRNSARNPLQAYPGWEVLLFTFLSAIINYPNIMTRGSRSELLHNLFSECETLGANDAFGLCEMTTAGTIYKVAFLITASGLGALLTAVNFSLQIPAGIILPSLAVGALYGRALGVIAEHLQSRYPSSLVFSACESDVPCVTPGTYAIVGAASALAGVTRMTVSIVVIMFEITGALTYVLPIMIAVMLSKWVGDVFSKQGIYEAWISFNEYPYLDNKDDTPAPDLMVSEVMTPVDEMICIEAEEDHSIQSLSMLLRSTHFRGFPVVLNAAPTASSTSTNLLSPSKASEDFVPRAADQTQGNRRNKILLGYISRTELSFVLNSVTVSAFSNAQRPPQHSLSSNLPSHTLCYFVHKQDVSLAPSLDLRPWMDQTPMTLNSRSSLQLALKMFQRLGLRYLLVIEKGQLKGVLTKKDIWLLLGDQSVGSLGENGVSSGRESWREQSHDEGRSNSTGQGHVFLDIADDGTGKRGRIDTL